MFQQKINDTSGINYIYVPFTKWMVGFSAKMRPVVSFLLFKLVDKTVLVQIIIKKRSCWKIGLFLLFWFKTGCSLIKNSSKKHLLTKINTSSKKEKKKKQVVVKPWFFNWWVHQLNHQAIWSASWWWNSCAAAASSRPCRCSAPASHAGVAGSDTGEVGKILFGA